MKMLAAHGLGPASGLDAAPSVSTEAMRHASTALDAAALVMVALVFLTIGGMATLFFVLWKRSRRPDPTLLFIDSLRRDAAAADGPPEPIKGWEKPADWWKNDPPPPRKG